MNRTWLVIALVATAPAAGAQSASVAAGASVPMGDFAGAANAGFGFALLSRTDISVGPFDLRVDFAFDRFGGKGTIARYQYTSFAVNLIKDAGTGVYWLGGIGLYNAQDQAGAQIAGRAGNANHSHVGAQAGLGVNFTLFGRGAFVEADAVKLFAPGPGITWIPFRLGIRI